MSIRVTCKVSTDALNAAIKERVEYGRRTLPEIVNTSAYYIALNTINRSPFAKQDQIDRELDVFTVPTVSINSLGEVTIKPRQRKKFNRIGGKTLLATGKRVPLAALIIAARASDHYKGNPKWKLDKNPFKDVSPVAGRSAMARLTMKMLRGRHSSTSFFRSAWVMALTMLRDFIVPRLGGPRTDSEAVKHDYDDTAMRGGATVARPGQDQVFAQIDNRTGTAGFNAEEANQALIEQESGPLQQSIDEEAHKMVEYMRVHEKPGDDKFNRMAK